MEYDLLFIHELASVIKVEAGRIKAKKNVDIQRYGVRRFEGGKMFQTSRLGAATLDRLIADTKEWGGNGTPHTYGLAPAMKEARAGFAVKADYLKDYEYASQELKRLHPECVFHGRCEIKHTDISLQSSYGLDLEASGGSCEWYFEYQRKGSGNIMDGIFYQRSAKPDILGVVREHSSYIKAQAREVKLSPGRIPVLFANSVDPIEKLIESIAIHKYSEGAAVYSGQLGKELFDPRVTLIDGAYDPVQGHIQFFDGEGIVREKDDLTIINKGQFCTLISDLRFGKKYGHTSTGNGLRAYNKGVTLAPRALRFAKGEKPWRDIVKGLDRCLLVMVSAGGDSNDLGEFSTPVQVGYILEKGEIAGRAPQVTVKTSVTQYLKTNLIDVAADDFYPGNPSACIISEMDVF